ncbi:MAG: hypothetical protein L6Q99_08795 [Planctomycetes bacterium]|nr:hypothetical protein [Planctomycetota bacterium]
MRTFALSLSALAFSAAPALAFDGPTDAAPVCQNNGPYVFEANNAPGTTTTDVQLSSAGSFDPDGDALTFFWFEECPRGVFFDPTAPDAVYTIDMAGQCSVTCVVELRVTGGNQTSKCVTTVTVQDTTPPNLTVPADVGVVWGDDTSPASTGTATATDNGDPAPVITYTDVVTPSSTKGLESTITRTWCATDYCGNQICGVQTILVYSPNQSALPNFDFDTGSCPNQIHRGALHQASLTILNSKKFNPTKIDWSTVELQRRVPTTGSLKLAGAAFTTGQFGKVTATASGLCNSASNDGKTDLRIAVDEAAIVAGLGLDADPAGSVVEVAIRGRLTTGEYFFLRDKVELP